MKKLLLLLAVIAMTSCDSKDESINDEQQQEDSYKLVKEVIKSGNTIHETITYTYNSEFKIIKETNTTSDDSYSTDFQYDNSGILTSFTTGNYTLIFTYENDLIVKSVGTKTGSGNSNSSIFLYNDKKQMISETRNDEDKKPVIRTLNYTYDDNGNYITEQDPTHDYKLALQYDNKKNPHTLSYQSNFFPINGFTPNNLIESRYDGGEYDSNLKNGIYEYEYNDKGYPTVRKQYDEDHKLQETIEYTYEEL